MRRATIDQLSFTLRASGLRARRSLRNWRHSPARLRIEPERDDLGQIWPVIHGQSTTALWSGGTAQEWRLTAGKVQNLRQAISQLNGLHIPAGEVFSFWRHVARPTRRGGYIAGRELREGCMVASIGGGLCQLSNALYAAAIEARCEIVERHRHSRVVPGSLAEVGLDATIFWNYVDLRFRATCDLVIAVKLTATDLVLQLRAREATPSVLSSTQTMIGPEVIGKDGPTGTISSLGDCLTCGETSCVYVIRQEETLGRTAWLLDESWPEFDLWQQQHVTARDQVMLPLDGRRWRRPGYAWTLPATVSPQAHPLLTWHHGRRIRAAGAQGSGLQQALITRDQALAAAYHKELAFDVDRLVVPLNLLPHLWRLGSLGGRRFSVLMTRAPLHDLQRALDAAACRHPESATLSDFRAPAWLLAAEAAALAQADRLVTPHHAIAADLRRRYPGKVREIDWVMPPVDPVQHPVQITGMRQRPRVLFAGPSLARKGSYEMRQATLALPITLRLLNRAEETADFWQGLAVERVTAGSDPLADIDCVVLPAFVEHQPRLLLRAIARGIPVICSPACGLGPRPSIRHVTPGDATGLIDRLIETLGLEPAQPQRRSAE